MSFTGWERLEKRVESEKISYVFGQAEREISITHPVAMPSRQLNLHIAHVSAGLTLYLSSGFLRRNLLFLHCVLGECLA